MKSIGKRLIRDLLHRSPRVRNTLLQIAKPAAVQADETTWMNVSEAACQIASEDPEAARLLHLGVARLLPQNPYAQHRAGTAMGKALQNDEAIEFFTKAVRLDPNFDPFRGSLIGLAFEHLDYAQAITLHDSLPAAVGAEAQSARKHLLLQLMRLKRIDEAMARCADVFGPACRSVREAADGPGKYSARIEFSASGYDIIFGPNFLYWPFLVDRLLGLTSYLTRFAISGTRKGAIQLTLGDAPEGDGHQLCFSGNQPNHHLIPDPIFLQTNAYAHFRTQVAQLQRPWIERADKIYWRGSLTGQAETFEEIFALPRVKLVEMSLANPHIDARLTDLSQFGPLLPELEIRCAAKGIIGPKEDNIENTSYRYMVDLDGNTNSWPGLWTKLASGGTVIKLASQYRQWYYDRLKHGENVFMIESLEELSGSLVTMRRDPAKAESIAKGGLSLTHFMRPETEYCVFDRALEKALESKLA